MSMGHYYYLHYLIFVKSGAFEMRVGKGLLKAEK